VQIHVNTISVVRFLAICLRPTEG